MTTQTEYGVARRLREVTAAPHSAYVAAEVVPRLQQLAAWEGWYTNQTTRDLTRCNIGFSEHKHPCNFDTNAPELDLALEIEGRALLATANPALFRRALNSVAEGRPMLRPFARSIWEAVLRQGLEVAYTESAEAFDRAIASATAEGWPLEDIFSCIDNQTPSGLEAYAGAVRRHIAMGFALRDAPAQSTIEVKKAAADVLLAPRGVVIPTALLDASMSVSLGTSLDHLGELLRLMVKPGQNVLLPEQAFEPQTAMPVLAGAEPVFILTRDSGFKIRPDDLRHVILDVGPDTIGLMLLTNPIGPLGIVYSREELSEIITVLFGIRLVVDEYYSGLRHDKSYEWSPLLANSNGGGIPTDIFTIQGTAKITGVENFRMSIVTSGDTDLIAALDHRVRENKRQPREEDVAVMKRAFVETHRFRDRACENLRINREIVRKCLETFPQVGGQPCASMITSPVAGNFTAIRFSSEYFASLGIRDTLDLLKFFAVETGVVFRAARSMGFFASPDFVVRLNLSAESSHIVGGLCAVRDLLLRYAPNGGLRT